MSENGTPQTLYPESNEDLSSMLQDLSGCQAEIKTALEECRETEAGKEKREQDFHLEIQQKLAAFSEQLSQINSSGVSPEKSGSFLTLVFPCLILILALSAGIYSFVQLVHLNRQWHLKIEQKIDELSTLNQIIQSFKDRHKEE